MRVVEHIDYDFDGSFSKGTRPIPRGDYRIVEMSVSENGRPLPIHGAPYDLSWDYSAKDEKRTFDVAYTVLGATKFGSDVGELYWKWVGDEHPYIQVVQVRLTVPGDGVGVKAWAHGPRARHRAARQGHDLRRGRPPGRRVRRGSGGGAGGRVHGRHAGLVAAAADDRGRGAAASSSRTRGRPRTSSASATRLQWAGLAFIPALLAFFLIWRKWGDDPEPAMRRGRVRARAARRPARRSSSGSCTWGR